MTTKFKVGDRVRHRTMGEGVVVERAERFRNLAMCGEVCYRLFDCEYDDDDHHSTSASNLTLVEPAPPPPDTRKRLREYTDLADGDVADLRTRMEAVEGRIDTIVGIKMARNDDEKGGA